MIGVKLIAGLMIVIIFLSLLFFVPTGESQTIDAPFGDWFVEVEGVTTEGETIQFSLLNTIGSKALSFTYGGQEVDQINCRIYAKATGEGYEYCDIDLSQTYISSNLMLGNKGYEGETIYGPSETKTVNVNGEKELVMTATLDLNYFEDIANLEEGTATLEIYCFKLPIRYRGRNGDEADPWVEEQSSFFVHTGINFQYEEEQEPVTCNNPYPGDNCFTNPSACGSCNSKLRDIGNMQKGVGLDQYPVLYYKYHISSGWTDWKVAGNGDKIQVFYHHNVFCLTAKSAVPGTVRGWITMISPSGKQVSLNKYKSYDNSNLDEHVNEGGMCYAYFSTGWESGHLLTENGYWTINGKLWVDADSAPPSPSYYDVTIKGDPSSITEFVELDGQQVWDTQHTFTNVAEGSHEARARFHVNPTRYVTKSFYVTGDMTVTVELPDSWMQMISFTMFSIEVVNDDFQKYEFNGNYLGD